MVRILQILVHAAASQLSYHVIKFCSEYVITKKQKEFLDMENG